MTTIVRSGFDRSHFPNSLKALYDALQASPLVLTEKNTCTLVHVGPNVLPIDAYQIDLVTAGVADPVALPAITAAIVGQRHVIKLATRTGGSDTVAVDFTNLSYKGLTISAVSLASAGKRMLVEARMAAWEIIDADSGVVTAA